MEKKYNVFKIVLTPITPYFFGKELQSDLGNKNDYFQTSSSYPQQTTLLGMLRHKVLRDNHINLDENNYRVPEGINPTDLIGTKGFAVNNNNVNFFGKIHSISPCFLLDEKGEHLWNRSNEWSLNAQSELCLNGKQDGFIWEKNKERYLSKHPFEALLNQTKKGDCIQTANCTGIHKGGIKAKTKEDSFFIMAYSHLAKKEIVHESNSITYAKIQPLSFAFVAMIESEIHINTHIDFMPIGKEKSMFKVETQLLSQEAVGKDYTIAPHLKCPTETSADVLKCVLLSDARLSDADLTALNTLCILQITTQQRFRFIERETKRFNPAQKPNKAMKAYNLMAKGSVLFVHKKDKTAIETIFNRAQDFKQIGYNYITFVNAKTI